MARARKPQALVHEPKKLPRQQRAQATFDALVDATARVLVRRGYAGTTTNHIAEAAGVDLVIDAVRQVVNAVRDPSAWKAGAE